MSKWIRRGDQVIVIAGNEKGKTGEVISRGSDKVVIQGLNMRKKHVKKKEEGQTTGIIDMEMPIHISNVSLVSAGGKPVRVKVKLNDKNEKELVYKENGKDVLFRSVKKHAG